MRVTCPRDELAALLAIVGRAVSSRASLQILSGILLRVEGDRLELAATDMDVSLRGGLPVETAEEGSVAVQGRLLTEIVRMLPAATVELEHRAEEGSVLVTSGSAEYRVRTFAVEDFPRLPELVAVQPAAVEAAPFLDAIERVSRAAGRDESRPVLTGVLVRFETGRLVMVSTDSYRLAVRETLLDGPTPELEAIVPARALEELRRIATGAETVEVGMLDNHAVFGVDGIWLTSRKIDGQFPDHAKLIPALEDFRIEVRLARSELLDVVRRIAVMAPRSTPLRLALGEGELTISAQAPDLGEARETLPAAYSGEAIEVGFNAEYLRDGIESVEGDVVVVRLIEPLRPGLVHGTSEGFRYLIMPIRLPG